LCEKRAKGGANLGQLRSGGEVSVEHDNLLSKTSYEAEDVEEIISDGYADTGDYFWSAASTREEETLAECAGGLQGL